MFNGIAINAAQTKILKGSLVVVVATILFPPFELHWGNGRIIGLGFGFLLSWPSENDSMGTVDVSFLVSEWLAVGIVGAILWVLARDK